MLGLPLGLAIAGVFAATPVLETSPSKRIKAVFTYEVNAPKMEAREWTLFAARLPELPGQTKVSSTCEPKASAIAELSALRRPVWAFRLPVRQPEMEKHVRIKITYQATLHARKLIDSDQEPPAVTPLTAAARKQSLAASNVLNFNARSFQQWLDDESLRRGKDESDIDFAKRALQSMRRQFKYEYRNEMDRRAAAVCKVGKSDCGGLSVVFVSILRANGVPARVLGGRWAESVKKAEKLGDVPYNQTHIKSEFFAAGVGWVPVDASFAIQHDMSKEGLQYFGNDLGDFVVLHVDPDLVVDAGTFGKKTIEWMQTAGYWVSGPGNFNGSSVKEDWQVRTLP